MEETKDLYKEHNIHDTYEEHCSECFKENRLIKAKRVVLGRSFSDEFKFRNPYVDNYPLGYIPE